MASLNALADKYSRQFCLQKVEVLCAFRENGVPETEDEQIALLLHHHGRELAAKKVQYAGLRGAYNRKEQEVQNLSQRMTEMERTVAMMQAELMAIRLSQNSQRNYSAQQLRIGDNM